jgi:hypothetical protein
MSAKRGVGGEGVVVSVQVVDQQALTYTRRNPPVAPAGNVPTCERSASSHLEFDGQSYLV